jgi:hypothetical protein
MIIDDTVRNENRRNYCRVEACIPFAHRLVPEDEHAKIRSHIGATHIVSLKTMPAIQDPAISEWVHLLNTKLDTVIRLLTLEREGFYALPFECINIGGGGLRFFSPDKYEIGDTLEIRMILPLIHSAALYVYATVFSVSERNQDGNHDTAVQFIKMDDTIQDEIIRFVFEREREILRYKKGQLG